MTEVEMSQLISRLTDAAKTLNQKSDSLNALIERFQAMLRKLNVGIEIWGPTLYEEPWFEENQYGEDTEVGSEDTELGFVKWNDEWILATRTAYYRDKDGSYKFSNAEGVTPLLKASRATRIHALTHFPALIETLTDEAEAAVSAIDNAEKLVTQ